MCIRDLKVGEQKTIACFDCEKMCGKLLCMGVKPGCKITLLRKTNFDKTYYVKVDAHRLAMRADEAALIQLV